MKFTIITVLVWVFCIGYMVWAGWASLKNHEIEQEKIELLKIQIEQREEIIRLEKMKEGGNK